MTDNKTLSQTDIDYYLQVFKRYPLAFERGEGVFLYDVEGKKYLDALAGIAVNSLGYNHPKLINAIKDQADKLLHISNFFVTKPQVELAKLLVELSGLDRVFFTNSGAESVEGAIKVARKFGHAHDRTGAILSLSGNFHGRTLATIAAGKRKMQEGFDPMPSGFHQIPFNDITAFEQAIDIYQPAAIILEPIQGEGGINMVDVQYLESVRKICDANHTLLILDEIQCGVGRTGTMFYHEQLGIKPDIMTLAKGLGGGVPVGAFLMSEKVNEVMDFGDHGTTFGGNPLSCAAALACLEVIGDKEFLNEVKNKGEYFRSLIVAENHSTIKEVRGAGLMLGIDLKIPSKPVVKHMLDNGVIANATADSVVRIVPPLTISRSELKQVFDALMNALKESSNH